MNAVEIEEAVSTLAERPFDAEEFPFAFLQAFANKATTIKRLRSGASNSSDRDGVLQRNNIHIKVCPEGETAAALKALKSSQATARARAKFVLATDGQEFHAEDLTSGDVLVCDYPDFPEHFGFFLPLAGITTVRQIRESAFDIKATGRLNRLYVELLKENPGWGAADRRHEMNHFMARLIFCFFAEDTQILAGQDLFTGTIERMSARDSSNTHDVISEIFRAMNTEAAARQTTGVPRWADAFPYVNGGLFAESTEVPRFSRRGRPTARCGASSTPMAGGTFTAGETVSSGACTGPRANSASRCGSSEPPRSASTHADAWCARGAVTARGVWAGSIRTAR